MYILYYILYYIKGASPTTRTRPFSFPYTNPSIYTYIYIYIIWPVFLTYPTYTARPYIQHLHYRA